MSEAAITKSSPSQTIPLAGILTFGFGIIRIVFVAIASDRPPHAGSARAVSVNVTLPVCPGLGINSGSNVFWVPRVIAPPPESVHW